MQFILKKAIVNTFTTYTSWKKKYKITEENKTVLKNSTSSCWISSLGHETFYNTMKTRSIIITFHAKLKNKKFFLVLLEFSLAVDFACIVHLQKQSRRLKKRSVKKQNAHLHKIPTCQWSLKKKTGNSGRGLQLDTAKVYFFGKKFHVNISNWKM